MPLRPSRLWIALFLIGASGILASGLHTRFSVLRNDFWGVFYYARHLSWVEERSLYNGFFPIGYAVLLRLFPLGSVVPLAYLTNALLTGLLAATVSSLVASSHSRIATAVTFAVTLMLPIVFSHANAVGPDIGPAAWTAAAVWLLWKDALFEEKRELGPVQALLVGLFLGLSALWRSHGLVSSAAILVTYLTLEGIRPIRRRALMLLTFLFVASSQVFVNLISGHGPLETAQKFNIFKSIYGVDWIAPPAPAVIEDFSLLALLQTDPGRVASAYLPELASLLFLAWPALACFWISPARGVRRYALFALIVIGTYAIPVALGGSARGPLPVLGLFLSSLGLLTWALLDRARALSSRVRWLPGLALSLVLANLAFPATSWVAQDLALLRESLARQELRSDVEELLRSHGMESPDQVYTNHLILYLPTTPPYEPVHIGGWSRDWLWGYRDAHPDLPLGSWQEFSTAAVDQGIRFLVISPRIDTADGFFKRIYRKRNPDARIRASFLGRRGNLKVFALE